MNDVDSQDQTALMYAVKCNWLAAIPHLLAIAPDLSITNKEGKTALELAYDGNKGQIFDLLLQETIRLSQDTLTSNDVIILLKRFPNLTTLDLSHCPLIDVNELNKIIEHGATHVERLILDENPKLTNFNFPITKHFPRLRYLSLQNCPQLKTVHVGKIPLDLALDTRGCRVEVANASQYIENWQNIMKKHLEQDNLIQAEEALAAMKALIDNLSEEKKDLVTYKILEDELKAKRAEVKIHVDEDKQYSPEEFVAVLKVAENDRRHVVVRSKESWRDLKQMMTEEAIWYHVFSEITWETLPQNEVWIAVQTPDERWVGIVFKRNRAGTPFYLAACIDPVKGSLSTQMINAAWRESHNDQLQRERNLAPRKAREWFDVLSTLVFNEEDVERAQSWAGVDEINALMRQALETPDGELATYIAPINFAYNSEEGMKDIAKHLCKRENLEGERLNDHYKGTLNKPFVVIANTHTVLAKASNASNTSGGAHWISWVLLPKGYRNLQGEEGPNHYRVLFFDSLGRHVFPEELKQTLLQGMSWTELTDTGEKTMKLLPFCNEDEIEFVDCTPFTGQQIGGSDCGWWATYYALLAAFTGDKDFLLPLQNRKIPATPLRHLMALDEGLLQRAKRRRLSQFPTATVSAHSVEAEKSSGWLLQAFRQYQQDGDWNLGEDGSRTYRTASFKKPGESGVSQNHSLAIDVWIEAMKKNRHSVMSILMPEEMSLPLPWLLYASFEKETNKDRIDEYLNKQAVLIKNYQGKLPATKDEEFETALLLRLKSNIASEKKALIKILFKAIKVYCKEVHKLRRYAAHSTGSLRTECRKEIEALANIYTLPENVSSAEIETALQAMQKAYAWQGEIYRTCGYPAQGDTAKEIVARVLSREVRRLAQAELLAQNPLTLGLSTLEPLSVEQQRKVLSDTVLPESIDKQHGSLALAALLAGQWGVYESLKVRSGLVWKVMEELIQQKQWHWLPIIFGDEKKLDEEELILWRNYKDLVWEYEQCQRETKVRERQITAVKERVKLHQIVTEKKFKLPREARNALTKSFNEVAETLREGLKIQFQLTNELYWRDEIIHRERQPLHWELAFSQRMEALHNELNEYKEGILFFFEGKKWKLDQILKDLNHKQVDLLEKLTPFYEQLAIIKRKRLQYEARKKGLLKILGEKLPPSLSSIPEAQRHLVSIMRLPCTIKNKEGLTLGEIVLDNQGTTLLHDLIETGNWEIVHFLLEEGIWHLHKNEERKTIFEVKDKHHNIVLNQLFNRGKRNLLYSLMDAIPVELWTIKSGQHEEGNDVLELKDDDGNSLAHHVFYDMLRHWKDKNHISHKLMQLLIEQGVNMKASNQQGQTVYTLLDEVANGEREILVQAQNGTIAVTANVEDCRARCRELQLLAENVVFMPLVLSRYRQCNMFLSNFEGDIYDYLNEKKITIKDRIAQVVFKKENKTPVIGNLFNWSLRSERSSLQWTHALFGEIKKMIARAFLRHDDSELMETVKKYLNEKPIEKRQENDRAIVVRLQDIVGTTLANPGVFMFSSEHFQALRAQDASKKKKSQVKEKKTHDKISNGATSGTADERENQRHIEADQHYREADRQDRHADLIVREVNQNIQNQQEREAEEDRLLQEAKKKLEEEEREYNKYSR